jgi:hypothetical protein
MPRLDQDLLSHVAGVDPIGPARAYVGQRCGCRRHPPTFGFLDAHQPRRVTEFHAVFVPLGPIDSRADIVNLGWLTTAANSMPPLPRRESRGRRREV